MTGSWYGSGGSESAVSMTGTSWLKCWSKYTVNVALISDSERLLGSGGARHIEAIEM
jgi:hypothetical protein